MHVVTETAPASARSTKSTAVDGARELGVLSEREREIARAIAEAAMPGGGRLPGGGLATVRRFERLLAGMDPGFVRAARAGLWAAEGWGMTRGGRPLSKLEVGARERALEAMAHSPSRYERWAVRAVLTPLKSAHFDDASMFAHVGCRHAVDTPPKAERAPWMAQVIDGRTVDADLDLRCEVVVVGTGAGGAATAYELARQGRAVLLLEAGHMHGRQDFRGRSSEAYKKMYLGLGSTIAIGNVATPVWAGRGVGGSTTINSGTCYRAPDWTLSRWAETDGLTMLSADALAPYYDRVETMLGVAEAPREHLGGVARVIARGAGLMQLSHKPLRRNAPGCDGQGVCCFGCPTGAKRSTDVSYVPEALKRGAQLVTGAKAQTVTVVDGRARGVVARLSSGKTLRVHADAVVVSGGALLTPLLLERSGLCGDSGMLGRNLSIHPATKVMALFDEEIDLSRGIPQSYAIDTYAREGIMFEGASTPLDVAAVAVPWVGRRFMDVMQSYAQLATFGFMIQDTSRGRVRPGLAGDAPLIFYDLNERDTAQMQRAIGILAEVFLEAGAKRVMPMVHGCEEISSRDDLERLRAMKMQPGDFEVTAYHPLGTCRMGTDPRRSCVGPDGNAHDVDGLVVADGSAVPSSLGVNPQLTIMALALRSAEALDERLRRRAASTSGPRATDTAHAPSTPAPVTPAPATDTPRADAPATAPSVERGRGFTIGFSETMRGEMRALDDPSDVAPLEFSITARSPLRAFAKSGELAVSGTISAGHLGHARPTRGVLGIYPIKRKLSYSLDFSSTDGAPLRFVGQKRLRLGALLDTMTRLPGRVVTADGDEIALAEVRFDLRDLPRFVSSFHWSPYAV